MVTVRIIAVVYGYKHLFQLLLLLLHSFHHPLYLQSGEVAPLLTPAKTTPKNVNKPGLEVSNIVQRHQRSKSG